MAIMKVFTPWNSAMLQNRPYPRELVLKSFLAHHWSFLLTTQYYTIWVLLHFPSRLLLLEATDGILSRHSYPHDPHSSWPLSMGQGQLSPSSVSSYNIVISWVPSDSKFSSWSVSTVLFLSPSSSPFIVCFFLLIKFKWWPCQPFLPDSQFSFPG